MEDRKLSKIQNIVIGGAVMSIVVPHVADKVLTLSFNKYNNRKNKKDKEYDN